MLIKLLIIIAIALLITVIGGITYLLSTGKYFRKLYHDVFEWHLPTEEQGFDGCSMHSTCKICGKWIMQDGQGNWF